MERVSSAAASAGSKEYARVLANEDEDENDGIFIQEDEDDNGSFVTASQSVVNGGPPVAAAARRTLFPDDVLQIAGVRLVEGTFSIKFAKFLIITYLGIMATYYVVRYMVGTVPGIQTT
jgi:hypothetical protein